MAFLPYKVDGSNRPQSLDYLPCASGQTPKVGLAMKYSSGALVLCSGTNRPDYICMTQRDAALTAIEKIPVLRINHDMVFETVIQNDGDSSAPKIGTKQTIHTDGMQVTKTSTSGVAEVVGFIGTGESGAIQAGDKIFVRFP